MYKIPVLILCALYFAMLIGVSAYSSKKAGKSFTAFAIGGGALPVIYVVFTSIASQFGSGNFIGHGDSGYLLGLPWIPFVIGEQFALAIFAFLFARFHQYNYNTLAEFCDRRITRDNVTRAIIGVLIALPCLAWVGGQAMGLGFLFNQLTGIDANVIVVIAGLVFIIYGALGGILGIARVDLVQGVLIILLGIFFYVKAFGLVDFSLATLGERITAIDPGMWSFKSVAPAALLTSFITGAFGTLSFQPFWQRLFAAKTSKDIKLAYYIGAFCGCVFVPCSVLVGMIARTINGGITGGATMWLAANMLPAFATILVFVLLLAATMSTGVALLNSAAIAITNDCVRPFGKHDDKRLIWIAKFLTAVCGVFCILAALKFDYILDLASLGYTACGGAVVPYLLIGWLWRDNRKRLSIKDSRISPAAARTSLVIGSAVAVAFDVIPSLKALCGGGVIPGAITTTALLFILSSIFTADYSAAADITVEAVTDI